MLSLLEDPRVNLLTNGGLEIFNVTHDDSGVYTCSVPNTNLSVTAVLEVLSESPPLTLSGRSYWRPAAARPNEVSPPPPSLSVCLFATRQDGDRVATTGSEGAGGEDGDIHLSLRGGPKARLSADPVEEERSEALRVIRR